MKRWRSIRRKIAKNSNRKGIYLHSIWNNFRKPGIYLMVTVILFITKVGILYTYGGELEDLISILVLMKVYLIIGRRLKEIRKLRSQSRKKMGAVMVMRVITTAIVTARMAVLAVMT